MRSLDIHMAAAIDEQRRMVLVTGAIDASGYTINMRIPVPSPGEWTIVKAETNLTEQPWGLWQMVLGEHISVPMKGDIPELLMSRNFEHARYIPEKNVVVFFGGEVRPGETVLKFFKLHTPKPEVVVSHAARFAPDHPDYHRVINAEYCGEDQPRIEITPIVKPISLPEVYRALVA